jgi:hypothetical protein
VGRHRSIEVAPVIKGINALVLKSQGSFSARPGVHGPGSP